MGTMTGRRRGPGPAGMSLLLRGLFLLPAALAQKLNTLETTYAGGWIQDGLMFDVVTSTVADAPSGSDNTVAPDGITVYGLNLLTPSTEEFCVEVYTKSGTYAEGQNNAGSWELLGSFALEGQGPNTPTIIPLGAFDPIVMGPDETRAFYVTTNNENLRYTALTDGTVTGDVFAEDIHHATAIERSGSANPNRGKRQNELFNINAKKRQNNGDRRLEGEGIGVQILTGVAKNYPFAESWPNRVFNGALVYGLGQDPSLGFLTAEQQQDAWAAKRGLVTCDAAAVDAESYPSAAPSEAKLPTASPVGTPTARPSASPSKAPTDAPTTLQSTIKKVATTLHGGLKQSGLMFDVRVPSVEEGGPPEGVTFLGVEMSTFLTDEVCVEVYSKAGSYEGFEQDVVQEADGSWSSPTWSILGAATVTGMGETLPTALPIGSLDKVYVGPGETQGFYVTMTVPEMRYTEPKYGETSGALFSASPTGDVELLVGSAVAYPFEEVWADRIFNGAMVYALGNVADGRYNDMTEADRMRQCPEPTEAPTGSPTKPPLSATTVAAATDSAATTVPGDVVDAPASTTTAATVAATATGAPESGARLADACPSADALAVTKDVEVSYEYTIVTSADTAADAVAEEMETALHDALVADKCGGARKLQERSRKLQDIEYEGFSSDPADELSNESCPADVAVGEGQVCYLIAGGVTAIVSSDADEEAVKADVGTFAEGVFTNADNYEELGVESVGVVAAASEATEKEPVDEEPSDESKGLSTTGIAIIAAVAGVLVLTILFLVAVRARKRRKTKRADSGELFREFPEEEEYARSDLYLSSNNKAGYTESFSPLSSLGSPPRRGSRGSGGAAVILNEADDISLFSSDKSKARFGPSSMLAPDSPGSRGSGRSSGSGGSKKSVEFVKAGQSFSSRSHAPEDTVDL
ncbi:hypothetical protein ACHAXT_000738 [Thalassiosira profunda]